MWSQVYQTVPPEQATARLWRACDVACFAVPVCLVVGKLLNSPNGKTVEAIVVVRGIDTTRIEVQVVAVGSRVQRGRPVVAVRASVVQARPVPVAGGGEEVRQQ